MTPLLAMVGLAAGSWVLRAFFIVLVPVERVPRSVRAALAHLAPAVLAALVAVEVAGAVEGLSPAAAALVLVSVLLGGVVVRLTGSMALAVAIGLGTALVLDLVMA